MPKMYVIWLRFRFQLTKDLLLELMRKHFSNSEHNSWQATGIWPSGKLSAQRFMHRLLSTITFPDMLRLNCTFENLSEMHIFLLFTHRYIL